MKNFNMRVKITLVSLKNPILSGGMKNQKEKLKGGTNYLKKRGSGAFLMTPWLIGIKYPEQIRFCHTNTVILLIILIIIKWDY